MHQIAQRLDARLRDARRRAALPAVADGRVLADGRVRAAGALSSRYGLPRGLQPQSAALGGSTSAPE